MGCVVSLALMSLIATFGLALAAKAASKAYQEYIKGYIDEEITALWQNRAALIGVVCSLVLFFSHIQFVVSD